MCYLYLFIIQNVTCSNEKRNYAILSKHKQTKLENLKEGELTGAFNPFGLVKDIIITKRLVNINKNIFESIIKNYNDNSNIEIITKKNIIFCIIDEVKLEIYNGNEINENIIYNYIGIYN
jgi:hypothetical protein